MVNGNQQLPDSWTWATVEDLSKNIQYGYTESANAEPVGPKFLRITDIQGGKVNWDAVPYCECSDDELGKYLLESGDIVFARTGATTRKSFLITNPPEAVFASYLIRLRLQEAINKKYFSYFLDSPDYWSQIMQVRKGSAQPGVNAAILAKLKVPVAPLPEQERILAKIEELFTQLESGTSALERVQAALRRYRASVLKAACEGWTTVGELSQKIQYGTSEKADLDSSGVPVLRMGNIQEGQLDFSNLKYLPEDAPSVKDLILEHDDLIFNRTNSAELVGKTAVYKSNHPRATFASYLIRVKFADACIPDYISYYINSLHGRKYIASVVSQQVGQANVNGTKLANMPIPLPPLEEQHRIVAEVERLLSVARQVESAVEGALVRAARMRQAVLKSAFEGRL